MHDRAVTQHVAERRQTVLRVIDQRAAEMAALRHVDPLDRGGVGGPAQRLENHPAAVRDGDRARIGDTNLPVRAHRSARSSDACVALRRASQPASARPTGPAPTIVTSKSNGRLDASPFKPPSGTGATPAAALSVNCVRSMLCTLTAPAAQLHRGPRVRRASAPRSRRPSTGTPRVISSQPVCGDDRVVLDADADVPVALGHAFGRAARRGRARSSAPCPARSMRLRPVRSARRTAGPCVRWLRRLRGSTVVAAVVHVHAEPVAGAVHVEGRVGALSITSSTSPTLSRVEQADVEHALRQHAHRGVVRVVEAWRRRGWRRRRPAARPARCRTARAAPA